MIEMGDGLNPHARLLRYEVRMFVEPWLALNEPQAFRGRFELAIKNALLESFVMHCRVLHDYFFKSPRQDDVGVAEILGWGSKEAPPAWKAAANRAHKDLAHLTRDRLTRLHGQAKDWDFLAIYREAVVVLEEFEALVRADRPDLATEMGPVFEWIAILRKAITAIDAASLRGDAPGTRVVYRTDSPPVIR